jgi:putative transposase
MTPPRCDALDYIHFLIAAQRVFTCTEAARCQPTRENAPAHDAFTRLLQRQPSDTEALWQEAEGFVAKMSGFLVLDDTTLDKPYAQKMELVTYHWSGKHPEVVRGINLLTLLCVDRWKSPHTCDFRVYDKPIGGKPKNEHFLEMLQKAKDRGFEPRYVLFDSWYATLRNLKRIRSYGWHFCTRLKSNRLVNADRAGSRPISVVENPPRGARGTSEGLWVRQGVSIGLQGRKRGTLGDR